MNLDDLKERISTEARQTWDRIQESAAYNQLRDRYENMTPTMQKLTLVGSVAAVAALILSVPYGNFTTSNEAVSEFEGKRMTIRELLKVSRESSEMPNIQPAPPIDMLRANIDNQIKMANLLPEQVKGIDAGAAAGGLIPANLAEGTLDVKLAKLNLRQVMDMGYKFQSINSSVKMKDMVVTANRDDNRYFDVIYKMVALAVPQAPPPPPEEPPSKGKRNKQPTTEE
ncbi:hypothetical protein [Bdellovibrio sp. NC01]|uniref:hypothetical protein n=1 Tax=Bdellovibrio sp. NC01 TaxID=2220073 RepID=UPI0011575545|nr:hypothetical protein [Bdellovibrio sp. NC01]QDK37427.1 hypothetical protein DOE51_07420 [Bdellovibrio sp. NC01]